MPPFNKPLNTKKAEAQIEEEVEDIIDQATRDREIICYDKQV